MCRMASEIDGTWQKLGVKICSICQFKASDDGVFRSHVCRRKKNQIAIKFKKQLNVFICSTCKIETNRFDFTEHLQYHLMEKPFKCSHCDKDFETKYGIYSHFKLVHPSMPMSYGLRINKDTEKYLEMARNKGLVFITSIRTNVAPESFQITAMQVDISRGSLPISQSPCCPGSSTSFVISSTAQSLRTQSSNDIHTRSLHPSRDNALQSYKEIPVTSESPETPLKHQSSGSNNCSNTKDKHNSTISSCFRGNNPSSFTTNPSQISVSSVVPVVTRLSKAEMSILPANPSCPTGIKNLPSSSDHHNFTSPAISIPASFSNEQHDAPQKASIPSRDSISQSRFNPQTSQQPIVSSTQLPTKEQHAPLKVSIPDKVSQILVSPATIVITELTKDPSSSENTSLSSGNRVSHSCTNFQTSVSPVVFLSTQTLKAIHTFEKPPCPQRGIKSQSHLGPQTLLSSVHSITTQHAKDGHASLSSPCHLYGTNSLSQCKSFHSSVNHFNVQPSVSSSIFVPSYPSSSVENAPQLRADPQRLIPPVVSMTPQLTARWPVHQIHQSNSAFQASVPSMIFPTNQSSKRMPALAPHPRPCGDKAPQSVISSSRAVLPPSIHLNTRAPREIPTLAKSLYSTKGNTAQSCVVKSVQQASVTHEPVCSFQQNSPTPTERLSPNEQHVQDVLVQPGGINLSIVKIDCDPELKLPVEEENLSKDLEYSFLNIFYANNEIIFVCSKCKVKFKERAPFFHHIWKNHAHTPSDYQCCSSIYNESCTHLQRIIKLLNNKAMGLFNIQLEKKQLSTCTNEAFSSVEDEKAPLLSVQQQPLSRPTSIESGSICQPNLSKCLEILTGNPNCITQLQIKVEEIDGGTEVGDKSLTGLPATNEVQAKVYEESNAGDILDVNNLGDKDVGVMTNPLNQLCGLVTSDVNAAKICEENARSNILLSSENFQSQNDKASENFLCTKPVNKGEENSNPKIHLRQGDHDVECSVTAKAIDPLSLQIQLNEEKPSGDPNKAKVLFNVHGEKSQLSACTNEVLPSVEDEEASSSTVQQQRLLPPTSMNSGSICQPNLSKRLEILTRDPDCITQLQITVEETDGGTGIGEDSWTGIPSTNEVQSKAKEVCEENSTGDLLDINNLGDKEVEVMTNPSNQLHGILTGDLNAVERSEENTTSNMSNETFQIQNDKASENLVSEKDVNKSKETANPKICLQKRLTTNLMTKCLTSENVMPVIAMEDDKGNPQIGRETTEIPKNGENSSNLLFKHSASKVQMKIKEMNSKHSQDDILPENRDTSHADHLHDQLMSDVEMNLRESREENSETDLHRLVVQEADEEKGNPESSVEVLQQLTGKVSTNAEEAICGNEEADGSNNSQIGKNSSSVMTIVTQPTSDASKSEINHIETTESNHGSSESECVQNSKCAKALEQTNDNSKSPSVEESLIITESSNDTLSNFFKCAFSHCDFSSCLPVDLLTHNQEVHGMECIFSCFYCGFEAKSTSQLLHHMDFHLDLTCDSYSGSIWKNSFMEKVTEVKTNGLGTTMNAIESDSRNIENVGYSCNLCEVRFTSLKALGCHFEESTLRTYSCRYCRAHFLDSKSAEKHRREDHPKLPLFRRQHRKLLCKDRVLNIESFSKLSKLRQKLSDADINDDVQGEANKVIHNCQKKFPKVTPMDVIECHSLTQNETLTEMETNEEVGLHKGNINVSSYLSSYEIDGSEDRERKEDMSPSQTIIFSSQPLLLCANESKSNPTVHCHVSNQLETGNEVGPLLNLDESISNPCNSSTKDQPAYADGNNVSFTVREPDLSGSVASESEPVIRENNQPPLAFHENSGSATTNTKSSTVPQTAGPREGVETVEGKNFLLLEKLSTPDFAVSKIPSNKPKKMPRIYDLCAEKSTAECLSSLYSQIQDGFYSCNSCHKKIQRLRSMLCHIFFCQGKISVVNCPYSCAFESEHPKVIIKHIQEKHPKKDPKCKSFRCINVNLFFQYLKDKEINQIVLEKACKMQNGHTTEMKTFRNRIKINASKDTPEALPFHQNSVDDENGTLAESQNEKRCKVTESAEVCENQDCFERKVPKIKKCSNDMPSPDEKQNRSEISQSKASTISLASETKCYIRNSEINMVENGVEMKILHNIRSDVEAEFLDKALSVLSVTEKQGMEMETKKLRVDPPSKDINSAGSKLLFDRNSLYQCKLCHFVLNFDIDRMMKHIGEKHSLFACGYCERPYYDLSILKNHIRFAHNKSPPKFQQISPELIFTRVDSTLTVAEASLDNDITSQNEENTETLFEGPKSPPTPLPNPLSKKLDTLSPNNICKDFPEESNEKYREKDDHPAKSASSVLKANDLNCQHLGGEIYLGPNHGKDGKASDKGAHESCCTPDFRSTNLGKQTLNDNKPKLIESKEIHKCFKENLSQIEAQEQSKKTQSSQHEQNPSTSEGLLFPGSKEISLKRKADEILKDDFLYNQQQHMKRPCCDKLVHKDTWEMETRCGADLSLAYSQRTNNHQARETSLEYAHEVKDQTSEYIDPTIDPSPEYACEANKPRSEYSPEVEESSPEYDHETKDISPEYAYETKEQSHKDINASFCTAHGAKDNYTVQQHFLNNNFKSGEGLKNKVMGHPFTCKHCMISLPSVSEMKIHFANDHFNKKSHWFEQRMEVDYSSAGEKLYHKTDVRPSVTRYLCGYCIFQSPMKESMCKHMASAHNSMEYHFVLPATEGDVIAYTERCCVTDEEEAGIACKHEMPAAEKSRTKLRYRCHLCDMYLYSEFLFRLHLAKHGGFKHCSALSSTRGLLLCATCGYVASSSHDLASHVNRHMTERRFSCSCCGFDDHKRKGVYVHIRKYHGDGSSAYAIDNELQNKDVDIRPKLVDLNPIVCIREINND